MLNRCSFFEIKKIKEPFRDNKEDEPHFYCVARSHPKWWKGSCFPSAMPSKSLLSAIKKGNITWEQYTDIFTQEILSNTKAKSLLKALWKQSQHEEIYLVCWEKTERNMMDTKCHTILLMEMAESLARDDAWTC